MEKVILNNLVIEVTRKCNIQCDHCIRGYAQNKDIDYQYINNVLKQIESIGSITFSGGEPSLNTGAIEYTLKKVKEYNICVDYFYIATNGIAISEEFIIACLKWYSYCSEKSMCCIHVSNDYYHAVNSRYDTDLLDGLSFFSRKFSKESYDYSDIQLINQGLYAENFNDGRDETESIIESKEQLLEETNLYLNCNGDIINGCDWSYDNQESHVLCDSLGLSEFINKLDYSLNE